MPVYAFHCPTCGNEFQLFLRPKEAFRGVQCPACGEHTLVQATDSLEAASGLACDLPKRT